MDVRTFVSIPVKETPEIEAFRAMFSEAGIRTYPPEQTHLTLRFVGEIPPYKINFVAGCVRRAVEDVEPFTMTVRGVGMFHRKGSTVTWMGAGPAGTLGDIAERISREFDAEGIPYNRKPFRPHVTVARVRDLPVPRGVFDHRDTVFSETPVDSVQVMRSELYPSGPRHTVLRVVELG